MVKRIEKPGRALLANSMKNLVATNVKVGYFADQGMHPEAKMNYPSLMYLQEVVGVRSRTGKVTRRVFELTMMERYKDLLASTQNVLKRQLSGRSGNMDAVKKHFGETTAKAIKGNFGRTTPLTPANAPATIERKGGNSPLIETSSLRDKLIYRIVNKGSK